MMKNLLTFVLLGMFITACGGETANSDNVNQAQSLNPIEDANDPVNESEDEGNDANVYSFLEEINDSLNAPEISYRDHFITLEQAASLNIRLVHGEGIDFDFALYDHENTQIYYSYSPRLTTSITKALVPNEYRIRVYTESEQAGDYTLTLSGQQLSYDNNSNWDQSIELEGIKQDELSSYTSETLDLFDFYTFTLEEDASFEVTVDKANDKSRFQISLYDADKNFLLSDISSTYDLGLDGALFSGQYYLVIDSIEANSLDTYDIALTNNSLQVDELSSFENPIDIPFEEWVAGSLNVNHDAVDIFRMEATAAGTHLFDLSLADTLTDGEFHIKVYDQNQVLISEGSANQLNFAELEVGTYFIKVEMLKGLGNYLFRGMYWE